MTLQHIPLDELTEDHLKGLIDNGVPEARDLEYKRDTYGGNDEAKREFLKDVSALANTAGGDLIVGIAEVDGVADSLIGITIAPADEEIRRLEAILQDGLEPRLIGTRMRSVSLADGRYALVIRVHASWNAPHRVVFKRTSRFYARNSAGAYELGVEQLRAAFLGSSEVERHLTDFRLERLARLKGGMGPKLVTPGQMIVHVVPLQTPAGGIDLSAVYDAQCGVRPMIGSGWTPVPNFDGVLMQAGSPDKAGRYSALVQVFRNGRLESSCGEAIYDPGPSKLPQLRYGLLVTALLSSVPDYCKFLVRAGASPPFLIMVSLLDVGRSIMSDQQRMRFSYQPLDRDDLLFDPVLIEDVGFGSGWQIAFRPLLDVWWNAYGWPRCFHLFDDAGNWNGAPVHW